MKTEKGRTVARPVVHILLKVPICCAFSYAGLAAEALLPLLDWAAAAVPARARAATPVFLFGTAGLRRLTEPQQAELMQHVRDTLSSSPFW